MATPCKFLMRAVQAHTHICLMTFPSLTSCADYCSYISVY
jgi:hypothetical protein